MSNDVGFEARRNQASVNCNWRVGPATLVHELLSSLYNTQCFSFCSPAMRRCRADAISWRCAMPGILQVADISPVTVVSTECSKQAQMHDM